MAWIIPENDLDAQQREFIDRMDFNRKNIWIKGFAGSGKSILLAYTAKKILTISPSANIVLIVFTQSLVEMFKAAFEKISLNVPVETYYRFMESNGFYDYILCDEVQDLTPRILREMDNRGTHVVVAGDSNQSIFARDPRWQEETVTPSEIGRLINGDAFELGIIHRLSRSIIDAVQRFLPRMNIFSSKRDMTHDDTQIRLCEAPSEEKEVAYIIGQATKAVNVGDTTAILIPSAQKIIHFVNLALSHAGKPAWGGAINLYGNTDFGVMNAYLKSNGIKIQYVGNGYGSFSENDRRIILMTYHSAKGLDFDNVFIPFANNNLYVSLDESRAKTLFMVAMTRARKNLYISYYGYPSDYLEAFKSNCSHIDISTSVASQSTTNNNNDNPWGF